MTPSIPKRCPMWTITAAIAYCCVVASTTSAFVTPSSRSPSFVAPKATPKIARMNLVSPPSLLFDTAIVVRSSVAMASSSTSSSLTSDQKSILSVGLWCMLDIAFRRFFVRLNIASKFPSSLGGCGALLAVLLLANSLKSSSTKESKLHRLLTPGAALLAKWLPVFFVPSLVTLPLVGTIESLGGSTEILKTLVVVLGGFYFTLLTTAGSVVGLGKLMGNENVSASTVDEEEPHAKEEKSTDFSSAMPETPVPAPKPFSDRLMKNLRIFAIFSGLAALEGASPVFTSAPARFLTTFQAPVLSLLLGSTTLASFVYGARLPSKFKKVVHPLVTCTALTWTVMGLFAKLVERSFGSMLTTYKMGKGFNGIAGTGAGDVLLFMLGPAVMSLAISMYDKRELIRDNFAQIATAITVSSLGGLFGTAWMGRLIGLI
mmetsp:Transcript_89249/g.182039  ORF Transcript_89249/g.182039 Transcript_89249/m.182039 type:complete len:431 (-) Transcript_89249:10-1302(-)